VVEEARGGVMAKERKLIRAAGGQPL